MYSKNVNLLIFIRYFIITQCINPCQCLGGTLINWLFKKPTGKLIDRGKKIQIRNNYKWLIKLKYIEVMWFGESVRMSVVLLSPNLSILPLVHKLLHIWCSKCARSVGNLTSGKCIQMSHLNLISVAFGRNSFLFSAGGVEFKDHSEQRQTMGWLEMTAGVITLPWRAQGWTPPDFLKSRQLRPDTTLPPYQRPAVSRKSEEEKVWASSC